VPTAEGLSETAFRLYYSAWHSLLEIYRDFHGHYEGVGGYEEEWAEYISGSQSELQSIFVVLQQSNELELKARICGVSPYLLLSRNESKLSAKPKDVDFSEFKTIDAVDLPGAVNTFCPTPISDRYITLYNEIRLNRNKISHLGQVTEQFTIAGMVECIATQFIELWPGQGWLKQRLRFASKTRESFFHDGRYHSAEAVVMMELEYIDKLFSPAQFKSLIGFPKKGKRFICHHCIDAASTKYYTPDPGECATALLKADRICCFMCGEAYRVKRAPCVSCSSDVIGDNEDEYVDLCHSCGESQQPPG
jgi:hypothetical protein